MRVHVSALLALALVVGAAAGAAARESVYSYKSPSRDGIGKVYQGREISHVMGHLGAGWLERDSRVREERTDLLLESLPLAPDDTVADVGAGTGYFAFPIAARVPQGRVLAVDIQPEMLAIVRQRMAQAGVTNVEPVLATETSPRLPPGEVDLVLLVDAYHEFSYPFEVMSEVAASLSDTGRVVLVEYRGEDRSVPIKPLHKMTVAQAEKEMAVVGLVLESVDDRLPWQHIMTFRRKAPER